MKANRIIRWRRRAAKFLRQCARAIDVPRPRSKAKTGERRGRYVPDEFRQGALI